MHWIKKTFKSFNFRLETEDYTTDTDCHKISDGREQHDLCKRQYPHQHRARPYVGLRAADELHHRNNNHTDCVHIWYPRQHFQFVRFKQNEEALVNLLPDCSVCIRFASFTYLRSAIGQSGSRTTSRSVLPDISTILSHRKVCIKLLYYQPFCSKAK